MTVAIVQKETDTLKGFRPWLYKTAYGLLSPGSPEIDDLVQEGYIAMWRAMDTFKADSGALTSWLTSKAKYRMLEVVHRRNWTGQPPRLHGSTPAKPPNMLSLDADRGDGVTLADILPADEEVMDAVLVAYHHGEIHKAISMLTPRQRKYVFARFWYRMTTAEMKNEIFGYDPSALWNSSRNGAKHKLAGKLSSQKEMG